MAAFLTVDMTVSTLVDLGLHHVGTARTPIVLVEIACSERNINKLLLRFGLAWPLIHLREQSGPARPRPGGSAGGGSQGRTPVTAN